MDRQTIGVRWRTWVNSRDLGRRLPDRELCSEPDRAPRQADFVGVRRPADVATVVSAIAAGGAALVSTVLVAAVLVGGAVRVAEAAAAAPARIERVRYIADGGATRVVVMLSRPVPHEVLLLAGDPARGSVRRLVLDFSNARLGPGAVRPIGVENGLLKQIRTGQFTARTVRVVLDLASMTSNKVWTQDDPPRVVVDIAGPSDSAVQTENAAVTTGPLADAAPSSAPSSAAVAGSRSNADDAVRADERVAAEIPEKTTPAGPTEERSLPDQAAGVSRAEEPNRAGASEAGQSARAYSLPEPGKRWRIVLDPGHGGSDPGARGVNGALEKDVVLAIADKLKSRLTQELHAEVLLTRSGDVTRSLAERTAFANANSADLFVSIHANADLTGQLRGIETYTLNNTDDQATVRLAKMENGPAIRTGRGDLSFILSDLVQSGKEEESIALAERVHSALLTRLRSRYSEVRDLGVKKGPFYVLVGAYMPCVLVEASFLSHPVEGRRLASVEYQAAIADGLYRGVVEFLGDGRLAKTL